MHKFVFIVLVLGLVMGCKNTQPIINTSVEKTVTFDSAQFLNRILECNEFGELVVSWYGLAQLENDSLRNRLKLEKFKSDSLERIGKHEESRTIEKQIAKDFKGKLIKPITATIKETTQTKPCDPIIIYKIHPLTWAAFILCFVFMACFILAFIYAYKFSKK